MDDEAAQRGPQRSWLTLLFAAVISVLVAAGVVAVMVDMVVGSILLQEVPEPAGVPTSEAAIEPRPTGKACQDARVGVCADDEQGVAPIPGVTVEDWNDRLPERYRPVYSRQVREGLLEGALSVREPVSGKPVGGVGTQMTVTSMGQVILTYGVDNHPRTVECAVDIAGLAPLSQLALGFVKQCAFAALTDEVAGDTRAWLDAKLRPVDRQINPADPFGAASLVTLHWSCGWLVLELSFSEAHAGVVLFAPSGRAPTACGETTTR